MELLLSVNQLVKKYDTKTVLDGVSFAIRKGEIIGLLGVNGSGKTTLMKIILGLTSFEAGEIEYRGNSNYLKSFKCRREFGYLLDCKLFEYLDGYDNLYTVGKYANHWQGKTKTEIAKEIKELLDLVDLPNSKKKVRGYSFGMKQRLGLAMSLMGTPDFLILDEPFVGLDPVGVDHLIEFISNLRKSLNITILISSHQLSEIEQICDRYLYITNQKVKEVSKVTGKKFVIKLENPNKLLIDQLQPIVDIQHNDVLFEAKDGLIDRVLSIIYQNNGQIIDIQVTNDNLVDLFRGESK
ncbi:MAG: ABC transporter ATP-binding protein [Streptococcaceae bacterium]|jgi:ABC-2 type transport system ATP-binding protein|nr:ABC transporter ATP-binding protein [Streptococcaceae bacterium]